MKFKSSVFYIETIQTEHRRKGYTATDARGGEQSALPTQTSTQTNRDPVIWANVCSQCS